MQRLKKTLDTGKPVLAAWCGITDPRYLEAIAGHSFDAVVLDMQHGFFDETSIQNAIATLVARGKAPLVRIPLARWDTASRVMDFGALAVIAPMINSADDARALVSATRFVPVGDRSFGPRHAASLYGIDSNEYLENFDNCSLALAMVETREAYNNLDEIIEVESLLRVCIEARSVDPHVERATPRDTVGPICRKLGADDCDVDRAIHRAVSQS